MATPVRPQRRTPVEKGSQLLSELLVVHRAKVIAAILAIIVIGAAAWFYSRSVETRRERAEVAYFRARQAYDAGNLPLAEADLRTVVTRYGGTAGGAQAAIVLAQVLYQTERVQEGIQVLNDAAGRAPQYLRAEIRSHAAIGHENLGQFAEAAGEHERAAEASRFPRERLAHRAAAARAYASAGQTAEALAIWRELEAEPTQFMANEARVRIGELTAQPEG